MRKVLRRTLLAATAGVGLAVLSLRWPRLGRKVEVISLSILARAAIGLIIVAATVSGCVSADGAQIPVAGSSSSPTQLTPKRGDGIMTVALTDDGRRVLAVTQGEKGTSHLEAWDTATGQYVYGVPFITGSAAPTAAPGQLGLWFLSGATVTTGRGLVVFVDTRLYDAGNRRIVERYHIPILDAASGKTIRTLRQPGVPPVEFTAGPVPETEREIQRPVDIALGPDARRIAVVVIKSPGTEGGKPTNELHLWDVPSEKRIGIFAIPTPVRKVSLSHDSRWAAILTFDSGMGSPQRAAGDIMLLDLTTGRAHVSESTVDSSLRAVFSPDARSVAALSRDSSITVWDVETGRRRFLIEGGTAPVTALAFSPDSTRLLNTTTEDQTVTIRDAETGSVILPVRSSEGPDATRTFDVPGLMRSNQFFSPTTDLRFSEDGRTLRMTDLGDLDSKFRIDTWDWSPAARRGGR